MIVLIMLMNLGKKKMENSKIGKIEQEKELFGYSYSVWIGEDEAFITKSLDTARIMSMLAITLNKLGVKRTIRNRDSYNEFVFEGYEQ
jgi:hypothetical protein